VNISQIGQTQRQFFNTDVTKELKFCQELLKFLAKIAKEYDRSILDALKSDTYKLPISRF
jgi:hypothetical protein